MSRAFVKETDSFEELPDRQISEHRNLVTADGLAQIEEQLARAQAMLGAANAAGDREAIGRASRELRYWTHRRGSAELQELPASQAVVAFGSTVTVERSDGRVQTFRIVGEDEADPAKGTLSYVSPMAQALLGKAVGDSARAGQGSADIVSIG